MTNEEAKEYIREWCPYDRQEEIIKALEQKPCEDATLKEIFCIGCEYKEQEPCNDAISRQAVLEYIEGSGAELGHSSENELVCQDIKEMPPVTPQQKMGRWVEEIISVGTRKVFCSECGCPPPFEHVSTGDVYSAGGCGVINKTKFCPNCGAKMSESEVSE